MSFRWRGLLASGVCLLGLAWAALGLQRAVTDVTAATGTLLRIERHGTRGLALIHEARAAERAYVAWGPETRDWEADVTGALSSVERELDQLQSLLPSSSGLSDLKAARASLDAFAQADQQARALLRDGLRTQTAGLIFGDGADTSSAALGHLQTAMESLRADASLAVGEAHRRGLTAAAIAAGLVLLSLLLLLLPTRRAVESEDVDVDEMLEPAVPLEMASAERLQAALADDQDLPITPTLGAPPPSIPSGPEINWLAVGDVCADFARITETRELRPLLDKALGLLDAEGLVVWIGEPGSRHLRPVMTLGFEPTTASRLTNLPIDADNATTTAFRTGSLQIVGSSPTKPGAVVAPLVTSAGCVGVVAVEIRDGREREPGTGALTRIIAAQMSAVLGTEPAAERARSAEAV